MGASRVTIHYLDPHLQRAAVLHAPEEVLGTSPEHELAQVRGWRESRPALISLTGNPFPTLMDGLDPARLAKSQPVDLISEIMPLVANDVLAWTMVGAPTPGWAASVGVADVARLWDAVAVAMRLDRPTRSRRGATTSRSCRRRAAILNGHAFDRVRYQGPGTDITHRPGGRDRRGSARRP